MLAGILVVLAATGPQADQLRQCQLALQFCAADGPIPLTAPAVRRSGSPEYNEAQNAAAELADAARRLSRCAERGDLDDDCFREARNARRAAEDYESASQAYQNSNR